MSVLIYRCIYTYVYVGTHVFICVYICMVFKYNVVMQDNSIRNSLYYLCKFSVNNLNLFQSKKLKKNQMEILELKNTMPEMKNSLEGLYSRLEMTVK